MKIFTFIFLVSWNSWAGRESHGILPDVNIQCRQRVDLYPQVFVRSLMSGKTVARYYKAPQVPLNISCEGDGNYICADKKSRVVIKIQQDVNSTNALIYENNKLIQRLSCVDL